MKLKVEVFKDSETSSSCGYFRKIGTSGYCNIYPLIPHFYIRGLGFKFVDFLCKRPNVCHTEIKML